VIGVPVFAVHQTVAGGRAHRSLRSLLRAPLNGTIVGQANINRSENLRSILMTLCLIACEAHTGKPQPSATPTARLLRHVRPARPVSTVLSAGQPCSRSASTALTILDRQGHPVDMTNEESLSKAMGQAVLVCAPVRRALAGRVVDADTKSPVADATVTVESWETPAPIGGLHERRHLLHSVSARTDSLGNWAVPAQSDWDSIEDDAGNAKLPRRARA
jgi:hypothetical protein